LGASKAVSLSSLSSPKTETNRNSSRSNQPLEEPRAIFRRLLCIIHRQPRLRAANVSLPSPSLSPAPPPRGSRENFISREVVTGARPRPSSRWKTARNRESQHHATPRRAGLDSFRGLPSARAYARDGVIARRGCAYSRVQSARVRSQDS